MALTRRALLAGVASGAPLITSSCANLSSYAVSKQACEPVTKDGLVRRSQTLPIRIDMHCHLLNIHDVNEASFVVEREFDLEEQASQPFASIVRSLTSKLGHLLERYAWSVEQESGHLEAELRKPNSNDRDLPAWQSSGDFCAYAKSNQRGNLFTAENLGFQITGLFSNRIRNAARLMSLFPDVDIFTPSMVDLYDNEADDLRRLSNDPKAQIKHDISPNIIFYSNLNLATNGRFLPLVSFNPGRQYVMELQRLEVDYFDWIERAITEFGFVGVKVHPSYGFSPINNLRYACFNASKDIPIPSNRELYNRFLKYDGYMERLFALCKKYDVPILTHSGDSISLNRSCMEGEYSDDISLHGGRFKHYTKMPSSDKGDPSKGEWTYAFRDRENVKPRDESDWTNSPKAWLAAMEKADRETPSAPKLRVCLAHFANGFKDPNRRQGSKTTNNVEISAWLSDAMNAENKNLYTDVSILGDLFKNGIFHNRKLRKKHRDLFKYVLNQDNALTGNIMYGTDWHMPTTAIVGARYFIEMEQLVRDARDSAYTDQLMGQNAVRFYGLGSGGKGTNNNRYRLEIFYKKSREKFPAYLGEIDWLFKT